MHQWEQISHALVQIDDLPDTKKQSSITSNPFLETSSRFLPWPEKGPFCTHIYRISQFGLVPVIVVTPQKSITNCFSFEITSNKSMAAVFTTCGWQEDGGIQRKWGGKGGAGYLKIYEFTGTLFAFFSVKML